MTVSDIDENANNYPAEYDLDNILAVASNDEDEVESFTAVPITGLTNVDVMAPGVGIISTVPVGSAFQKPCSLVM